MLWLKRCWFPQWKHFRPGGVFDRFRQSSGRMRLVSTPLWSLRPPMCPLWLIFGKAALIFMRVSWYADDPAAFAAQEERCSS